MKIKIKYSYKLLLLIVGVAFIAFGFLGDDKNGIRTPKPIYKMNSTQASGKQGDAYALNVNNIWMPLNRKGIIADVNVPPKGSLGQYAGGGFLFSSGFFMSGYSNGTLFANAAASASLVEDYIQGVVDGENDPNAVIYVVNAQDEPFGQSWQDWIDAVNLGADFVDGNGNGEYEPVDKVGPGGEPLNGIRDPWEDMPDLIGDELAWCVFHDGLPVAQRRWNTTIEIGMEVRQSVFAFASAGAIGNIVFVRYRFTYVGTNPNSPQILTDFYFGAWADTDLGDATDDVIGVDVPRNAGFTYGNLPDPQYGSQVPCFMIDFFSGPRSYINGDTFIDENNNFIWDEGEASFDTAYSTQGQIKGIQAFPGARNLPISSFVMYINGNPDLRDPNDIDEARNYCLGLDRVGEAPDPCDFPFGEVRGGVDCNTVDERFWFSGDPVTNVGWICNQNRDTRQMTNTGPFTVIKGVENEITIAYVVGRGANPLDGIVKARAIDDGAQNIFDNNFLAPTPPPPPQVTLSSSDNFIDITWDTKSQVAYKSTTPTWDLGFEGYQVWAFKTNIAEDVVSGQDNSVLLATYDLDNFIENIFLENSETGGIEPLYEVSPAENQMDSALYIDDVTGRIRLRVFNDPFSPNTPVVKGRPYYFAVISYALNYLALVYKAGPENPVGTPGDYYLSSFAFAQQAENVRSINSIVVGESALNPPVTVQPSNKISGASLGNVGYDVINNEDLTGEDYEVTFFKDSSSTTYSMFWKLKNLSTGQIWDSSKAYTYGSQAINQEITEGFITKVERQNATIGMPTYQPPGGVWYNFTGTAIDSMRGRGIWYMGKDFVTEVPSYLFDRDHQTTPFPFRNNSKPDTVKSTYLTTDKLRRVELRFGEEGFGKAYRYINGYKAGGPGQVANNLFPYAAKITSTDTVGKGPIGKWDEVNNRALGYVDVPFQAWVVDEQHGEEYRLAVGFIEAKKGSAFFPKGIPDGIWDPGTFIPDRGEYLIVFDTPYDPEGNQIELTGGDFQTGSGTQTIWADFVRWYPTLPVIPADAQNITDDQRAVFNSPCLSTMYLLGLAREDSTSWFLPGDVFTLPVAVYPYTKEDIYQFSTLDGTTVTEDQERQRWEKVNVYPNPLFGYNTLSNYYSNTPDEPFVTFTNLPENVTVKIFSLSGTLLRTLGTGDKDSPTSPFLRWNLQNESGLRVASGMYLAILTSEYGDKVLKFAIIMPQKQIQRF